MADDNDKPTITRRRALGGLATIGAAGALGSGTWAVFSDTEDEIEAMFTAGTIDGTVSVTASYNDNQVGSGNYADVAEMNEIGEGVELALKDVKPGDYGSITFNIGVEGNDAWVASCLAYDATEGTETEPEREAGDVKNNGELPENLLLVPFYSPAPENLFYDGNREPNLSDYGTYGNGTAKSFWNAREGLDEFDELHPMSVSEAVTVGSVATVDWSDGSPHTIEAPTGTEADEGCILLDGGIDPHQPRDATGVSPLQGGESINFGYDWHLPHGTGNKAQGDTLKLKFAHEFIQTRHTAAPTATNPFSYDPENAQDP